MKNVVVISLLFFAVILSGCTQQSQQQQNTQANNSGQQLVGNDRDVHGCIPSAGYSWCEQKQKCLRVWEEPCGETIETMAKEFCGKENISSVLVCGEYVKVVGSLIGAGSTFYKYENGALGQPIVCPVVGPDSMSEDCKQLLLGSNCVEQPIC